MTTSRPAILTATAGGLAPLPVWVVDALRGVWAGSAGELPPAVAESATWRGLTAVVACAGGQPPPAGPTAVAAPTAPPASDLHLGTNPALLAALLALLRSACHVFTGTPLALRRQDIRAAAAAVGAEVRTACTHTTPTGGDGGSTLTLSPLALVATHLPSSSTTAAAAAVAEAEVVPPAVHAAAAGYVVASLLALTRASPPLGPDCAAALALHPEAITTLTAVAGARGTAHIDGSGMPCDVALDAAEVLAAAAAAGLDVTGSAYAAAVRSALTKLPPTAPPLPPASLDLLAAGCAFAGAGAGACLLAHLRATIAAAATAATTDASSHLRTVVALHTVAALAATPANAPALWALVDSGSDGGGSSSVAATLLAHLPPPPDGAPLHARQLHAACVITLAALVATGDAQLLAWAEAHAGAIVPPLCALLASPTSPRLLNAALAVLTTLTATPAPAALLPPALPHLAAASLAHPAAAAGVVRLMLRCPASI